jgi:hypothetical protein
MGSTGAVRSRAYISGFSSTANTSSFAPAGLRPTTSRILSIRDGSGEISKISVRHGCEPKAY